MKVAQRLGLKLLLAVMVITMILPRPAGAQVTALDEVRDLLRYDYVEPVREKILNSPTIDAILEQLDDPHTNFFTAAEFEAFNGSLEQSFSGIGIYLDIVKEGVKVTSLIDGSPADIASLHAGDIIISINGHSLPGLSSEETILLLRGPEGSQVQLLVLRDGASFSVAVERKKIEVPSVTDEILPFNIGYLKITTFGSETGQLFANCLENLRQQDPNAYIVDLRDNGGGYVNTALNIAGFFIGDQVAMQTRYRDSLPHLDRAIKHSFIVAKPTIYLLNQNSASASEILAAAVKDYGKAVIIGSQSYGKGTMQQMISLDSGDYFKMTVARFLSPMGNPINKQGITPDLLIEKTDPLKAAQLLLSASDTAADKSGLVKVNLASQSFVIDTQKAQEPEYWQSFGEILDRVALGLMKGNSGGWENANAQEIKDRWPLYFPGYHFGNQLSRIPVDKVFTIHFPKAVNWLTVNQSSLELIASNGERIPLTLKPLNNTEMLANPEHTLIPGTSYWLVIHPTIQYTDNSKLEQGVVCTATVKDL